MSPVDLATEPRWPRISSTFGSSTASVSAPFGASDAALADVVAGRAAPRGHLPYNLPRSMAAVTAQDPAAPDDDRDPLFARGFGLRYGRR